MLYYTKYRNFILFNKEVFAHGRDNNECIFLGWFVVTAFIAINPVGAWKLFGKWQARSYPSQQCFFILRVFGIIGFVLPILYLISQHFN